MLYECIASDISIGLADKGLHSIPAFAFRGRPRTSIASTSPQLLHGARISIAFLSSFYHRAMVVQCFLIAIEDRVN